MKTLFLFTFIFLFVISGNAQKPYSEENLRNLTQEELDVYFKKAKNQKTTGAVIAGISPVIIISAFLIEDDSEPIGPPPSLFVGVAGVVTGIIGIIVLKKGAAKVDAVQKIKNGSLSNLNFSLQPYSQYNRISQKYQSGISLTINF